MQSENPSFYPYARQCLDQDDLAAVAESLQSDTITRGPKVKAFEESLASYCDAKHAVIFNSGTTALQAAYYAAKIGPYDHVITSPNTFVGTVAGALQYGAQLKLVDIDIESGNFDLKQFQPHLPFASTRGRLCIVPVHFTGAPVAMEALELCMTSPETVIIEDLPKP